MLSCSFVLNPLLIDTNWHTQGLFLKQLLADSPFRSYSLEQVSVCVDNQI